MSLLDVDTIDYVGVNILFKRVYVGIFDDLDWDDEAQHKAIFEKMQSLARAQLAAYTSTAPTQTPIPAPAAKNLPPATAARAHRPATPPAPQTPLLDEELKAYTLSYGGLPTFVYTAHTTGAGAAVAGPDSRHLLARHASSANLDWPRTAMYSLR